jgi:putative DNA-invertase from lambdoid prophage Rac
MLDGISVATFKAVINSKIAKAINSKNWLYLPNVPLAAVAGTIEPCPIKDLVLWTAKSQRDNAGYKVENLGGKSGRLRVGIYARVSTRDQNCDRQISDLKSYADRCNYDVVRIYKEVGSGAKHDRTERKKIIELARSRLIDAVLVTELSRWGRSTTDLIMTLEQLASYGVSLIAQTGMQFDLSTPHGKLIAQILSSMAEFERELIRERVRSGIAHARSKGKVFGRPRGGKIMDACDRINELRADGMSVRAIAREVGLSKSAIAKCPRCEDLPEGMEW